MTETLIAFAAGCAAPAIIFAALIGAGELIITIAAKLST